MAEGREQMKRERNGALDIYRYLTVTFAIVSHVIVHHGIYGDVVSGGEAIAKAITRTATPTLLILFGIMVEMVYARRFDADRVKTGSSLIYRALLCYLAFLSLAVLTFIVDDHNLVRLAAAVPLVSPVLNGNIFKIYAILLVLTFPVLLLRSKFGIPGLVALVVALWGVHFLLIDGRPELPFPIHHIGGLLLGIGDGWGPSILHASVLVLFGMLTANVLFGEKRLPFAVHAFYALIAISVAYLAMSVFSFGLLGVVDRIADLDAWRASNDFGYYAFGMLASLVILGVSYAANSLPDGWTAPARAVGGVTLMYFFLANVVISLTPDWTVEKGLPAVALVAAYIVAFSAIAWAWSTWGRKANGVAAINRRGPEIIASIFRREKVAGIAEPDAPRS